MDEWLHTERLTLIPASVEMLRALVDEDYALASRLLGAAVPAGWPDHDGGRDGLWWHLAAMERDSTAAPWRIRFVVERSSNRLIGSVNLKGPPTAAGEVEIGWGLTGDTRGRGFAAEASSAVIDWIFRHDRVMRVIASIAEDHPASQRVARRAGMSVTDETRHDLPVWTVERP
jgi:RimJ/RimL family protein N-acetyltransferase